MKFSDKEHYVIAELGSNHSGDINEAIKLIHMAKDCGCDIVKMQKRNNKKMFTKNFYNSPYNTEQSFGKTYGEHREFLDCFGYKEFKILKDLTEYLGMIFFATPFEDDSLQFLLDLGVSMLKVASCDITNTPFVEKILSYKLPTIISTGGSNIEDVDRLLEVVKPEDEIALMHCISTYPVKDHELNLNVIETMKNRYNRPVGFSSHHPGLLPLFLAYVKGARLFEVHITLDRSNKGTDNAFSLEYQGLRKLVEDINRIPTMLGSFDKKPNERELDNGFITKMGKSLYSNAHLPAGHRISIMDISVMSPGGFIPPYEIKNVVGKCLLKPLKLEDPFKWEDLI